MSTRRRDTLSIDASFSGSTAANVDSASLTASVATCLITADSSTGVRARLITAHAVKVHTGVARRAASGSGSASTTAGICAFSGAALVRWSAHPRLRHTGGGTILLPNTWICCGLKGSIDNVHPAHGSIVFMGENMAVEHAALPHICCPEAHSAVGAHGVIPLAIFMHPSAAAGCYHLHVVQVDVKRMCANRRQRPLLNCVKVEGG